NSLNDYRARVVIIEFNPSIPNDVVFIQDRATNINEGASLAALVELAKTKGYELIAVTLRNAIFVVAEEFPAFQIEDNTISAMRMDPANYVFSGYNGKVYTTMRRLLGSGRKVPFGPESLQALSQFRWGGELQGRADPNSPTDLESAEGILLEL